MLITELVEGQIVFDRKQNRVIKEAHGNVEHRMINRTNGVTLSCCHNGVAPFAMQKDRREWRSVRFTALGGQATRVAVVTESVHSPTRKPT